MRRLKLRSEGGRIWAGLGGLLLMAVSAFMVATLAFSTDSTAGKVQVAEASHDLVTIEQLEEFAEEGNASVTFCHTEGTGDQHIITTNINAFINDAGHFDADGNPQHEANGVHDFIISVEVDGTVTVFNDETCGAATATATATNTAVATATNTAVATATNTAVATATNTAVATATQQVVETSTPTNTAVPPTNTPVPPTNTPEPTQTVEIVIVEIPQPPAAIVEVEVTAQPPAAPVEQVLGVQQVIRPPSTGEGGLADSEHSRGFITPLLMLTGVAGLVTALSVRRLRHLKRR